MKKSENERVCVRVTFVSKSLQGNDMQDLLVKVDFYSSEREKAMCLYDVELLR